MVALDSCSFPIKPRGEPSQEGEGATEVTKSVAQYFEDQYKVKLQFPRLQCAVVRNNNRLPLEVRTAANQGGLCKREVGLQAALQGGATVPGQWCQNPCKKQTAEMIGWFFSTEFKILFHADLQAGQRCA